VNIDYTHSGIIEVKTKNPHTQVELKMWFWIKSDFEKK
jgi:hypothetical protein